MASNSYIGISGAARKVKSIYVGVDGKARKVKKGYIGVNGLARLFFSGGGELSKYGMAADLSEGKQMPAGASVGNYALVAGGTAKTSVDAYNASLTRSSPTALSVSALSDHPSPVSAAVGNYALFLPDWQTTNAYNASLTRSTPTALSSKRAGTAAAAVGNYALFAGGASTAMVTNSTITHYKTVDAYNASLTRSVPEALSGNRAFAGAAAVGNYVVIAGGKPSRTTDCSTTVEAYNTSLTRSTLTALSVGTRIPRGASVGNYALFAGGMVQGTSSSLASSSQVITYNASLTRSVAAALSVGLAYHAATTVGDFVLFGGGQSDLSTGSVSAFTNVVNAYNASLTRSIPTALSVGTTSHAAAAVGDYALFAGGFTTITNLSATVEVYQVK